MYSVGFHPWNLPLAGISAERLEMLRCAAGRPDVVAIGECGIDTIHPSAPPLAVQMIALRKQIEISEEFGLPLILHCVRAHDVIASMRAEITPGSPWIVHGFRGKPSILSILLRAGIAVSFGERFNPDSLRQTPAEMIFAETDESPLPITDILRLLHEADPRVTPELLVRNLHSLIKI